MKTTLQRINIPGYDFAMYACIDTDKPFGDAEMVEVDYKPHGNRTNKQNASIHKYCSMLSTTLNDAGLDQRKMLKPEVEIPWSMESVKDKLWRPIQMAMFDKKSSAKLDTLEVSRVYDVLNRHTASKLGVSVPFPSRFTEGLE